MQARATERAAAASSTRGPVRSCIEGIADWLSPMLRCGDCGAETKERHCEPTGEVRRVLDAPGPQRWSVFEREYRCPNCGGSIWVTDTPAVYPMF
jgi:uncharacterized protein with PIN domain